MTSGSNPTITLGLRRLTQDDRIAPGGSAIGAFVLVPDLTTLTLNKGISSPSATVQNWWMEDTPDCSKHLEGCPRWALQKHVNVLKSEYSLSVLMGFEIEVVFMRPQLDLKTNAYTDFLPLHTLHSWSNMTYQQLEALPMIEEIVATLAELDIHLPQFHSEAAPGQWEFPLPCFEPLKAVDVLYQARSVIQNIAKKHGLKATFYPRPYDHTSGSAIHAHVSINGSDDTVSKHADHFLAGILAHLPAILAFSLPVEESYERVKAGIWSGGEYVCWGSQNREAPLRACGKGHWEVKSIDGMGNMYLSMAALLVAGLDGLRRGMELRQKDCVDDPTAMGEDKRRELGIERKMPQSLESSLTELEGDGVLAEGLGIGFVEDYVGLRRTEMETLRGLGGEKRRLWLMERH